MLDHGPIDSASALFGIEVISPKDIWAVGQQYVNYNHQTLIEHWDGSEWSVVPSTTNSGYLRGITAVSANNIWAVGFRPGYAPASLILHWDGVQWSLVNYSQPARFFSVAAVSANDIYAVGENNVNPLVAHWNGLDSFSPTRKGKCDGGIYNT